VIAGRDDPARLASAKQLGFSRTVDVGEAALADALRRAGESAPFDIVIEATGVPALVPAALDILQQDGTLVVVGIHPRPAAIDLTRLVRAGQTIRGSYRAPLATWPRVLAAMAAEPERFRSLISHRLLLVQAAEGFDAMRSRTATKVMLRPESGKP
jgi:threonine 3-dehydrogenase